MEDFKSNFFTLTRESGAEFYCDTEISDWSALPVKIDTTNRCHLFCDKVAVSIALLFLASCVLFRC